MPEFILEKVDDKKFPYRLTIKEGEDVLLSLRVQDKWPGNKGHIFCLREAANSANTDSYEVERVPILSMKQYGKRLAIVLDRSKNKRCDFLFLKKRYKGKEGEYEQIFWRTQKALVERRPKVKLTTHPRGQLKVFIDKAERYPWKFSNCEVQRDSLPVGDYAIKNEEGILAIVERKTFENMIAEFGKMHAFHQLLGELSSYQNSALVIEANYSDFLNEKKLKFYKPSFATKAIAEIHALHPKLLVVFAGNRKLAQEWTLRYFESIVAHEMDKQGSFVSDVITRYGKETPLKGGIYYDMINRIKAAYQGEFTIKRIKDDFSQASDSLIRRVLRDLEQKGLLRSRRQGRLKIWSLALPESQESGII